MHNKTYLPTSSAELHVLLYPRSLSVRAFSNSCPSPVSSCSYLSAGGRRKSLMNPNYRTVWRTQARP